VIGQRENNSASHQIFGGRSRKFHSCFEIVMDSGVHRGPPAHIQSLVTAIRPARAAAHSGSIAVRTRANAKTAAAKANATTRTRRCSNFPDALAKKSTVANKTVFARY
jgi:hypothetical protein